MGNLITAIIGTRAPDVQQAVLARATASLLSSTYKVMISTGGALGIDREAMESCELGYLLVYLPWAGYNINVVPSYARTIVYNPKIHHKWTESVGLYHPAPERLSKASISLMARNYGIVEHANLVVAFPNEKGEGGTGQGIRIAKALGIPVIQINKGTGPTHIKTLKSEVLASLKLESVGK